MTFKKTYLYSLIGFLALYFWSFAASVYPWANTMGFILLLAGALVLSMMDWRYGLIAMAAELILNGKGYLFALTLPGAQLSLRIALWAVVMTVCAFRLLNKKNWLQLRRLAGDRLYWPVTLIALLVLWGMALGYLNHHNFGNLFFDANNWVYALAILPLLFWRQTPKAAAPLLLAALSAMSVISIWLLYAFSHDFGGANYSTYAWVRDSGLGEITLMPAGYYRVFIQSQIYLLPLFFGAFFYWGRSRQMRWWLVLASGLALAPLIISLSRSFWLGLAAGWLAWILIALFKQKQSLVQIAKQLGLMLAVGALSVVLLISAVKFPWPQPQTDVSAGMLAERAAAVSNEAGASSRWSLLPELWKAIGQAPLWGQGFGATVPYKSSDPRVTESSVNGQYTTFAFEWGWLDLWLKMGIIAVLAFVWLFYALCKRLLAADDSLALSLAVAIICLAAVNMFSPYLNHPLGLGMILFAVLWVQMSDFAPALAKNTKI